MRWTLLFTLVIGVACSSKIEGNLEVDGGKFAFEKCRSGQALGFSGIMVQSKDGRRIRLFSQPDGSTHAALFAKDAAKGANLGPCGTLAVKAQSSRVNSVTNLEGTARLDCSANGHSIKGEIKFENCH